MSESLVGAGLSTTVKQGADPVGDARHAEELGFDFVTLTDHLTGRKPTLETWTTLTWIAAATERIRVAPNVLGLPYRAPAVTAKMAETLHRLSGGRLILGLGAGGSNDEFRAFGLPVRTPGEKIDALAEGLRTIRGLWAGDEITFEGTHYRTEGARIAPVPDPPIPIWLGTYGRRAVALTAREADGWIPSMYFAPLERARKIREHLRRSAEEAGRDPDEITCAYNVAVTFAPEASDDVRSVTGPPGAVVGRLGEIREAGFTALNLWVRDRDSRERLAAEVMPALR